MTIIEKIECIWWIIIVPIILIFFIDWKKWEEIITHLLFAFIFFSFIHIFIHSIKKIMTIK